MPDPTNDSAKRPPDFRVQVTESLAGLVDFDAIAKTAGWLEAAIVRALSVVVGWILTIAIKLVALPMRALARGEDRAEPAFGELAQIAVQDLFGVSVDASALNDRGNRGRREDASRQIGAAIMGALTNAKTGAAPGQLAPSAEGAESYVTTVMQLALEGWLEGWLVEAATLGQLEQFGELDDIAAQVMGLGRMTRAVVRPILDARVITPFEWHVNKTYTPKLLSPAEAARQLARGRPNPEKWREDLRRQGYDEDRIEAVLNAQAKFHTPADLELMVRSGLWTRDQAIQHLRDQGFELSIAVNELALEKLKRIAVYERGLAVLAVDAYADGRLERSQLDEYVKGTTIDSQERAQFIERAATRRILERRPLSSGEARQLARDLILSVSDYRRALERENRTPEAIAALELSLRKDMQKDRDVSDLRAEQAAEREAEEAARTVERVRRRAEIEAERARARRGREADLERAVIRGRIPLERYSEVLADSFDADTVAIMVDLVETDRARYLERQVTRDRAAQQAPRRALDLGALERAVLARVLSIGDYRRRLEVAGFAPPDVEILAATLEATVRDRNAREARRRDLEPEALERKLSLSQLEALVLRGIRSLEDYAAALEAAGFSVADVDALAELLEERLAERLEANAAREAAAARLRERGLSLEQFRGAVLRGVETLDAFALFLQASGLTTDAQATLIRDLERQLEEVEAARRRREEADLARGARELPLSVVERAARLGVVSVKDYRARLAALGLDELDQAIAVEVLLAEVATVQTQRARRDAVAGELAARGISLGQFERAVKRQIKTLEEYRAFLIGQRYGPEDVITLVGLLEADLAQKKDAEGRRGAVLAQLAARGLDLEALERDVSTGARSLDSYVAALTGAGVTSPDVGLLVGLLVESLEGAASGAGA